MTKDDIKADVNRYIGLFKRACHEDCLITLHKYKLQRDDIRKRIKGAGLRIVNPFNPNEEDYNRFEIDWHLRYEYEEDTGL